MPTTSRLQPHEIIHNKGNKSGIKSIEASRDLNLPKMTKQIQNIRKEAEPKSQNFHNFNMEMSPTTPKQNSEIVELMNETVGEEVNYEDFSGSDNEQFEVVVEEQQENDEYVHPFRNIKTSECIAPLSNNEDVTYTDSQSDSSDSFDSSFEREERKDREEELHLIHINSEKVNPPDDFFESIHNGKVKFTEEATRLKGSTQNFDQTPDLLAIRKERRKRQSKYSKYSKNSSGRERGATVQSPKKKNLGDSLNFRRKTLQLKANYNPKETQGYMNELLRSINNKNLILLDPIYRDSAMLNNSIKVGNSMYNTKNQNIAFSGYKNYAVPMHYVDLNSEKEHPDASIDYLNNSFVDMSKEYRNTKINERKLYFKSINL